MTTMAQPLEIAPVTPDPKNQQWVADILADDQIHLSKAARLVPYGRAHLSRFVRAIMWALRVYVLVSFILIAVQIGISLQAAQPGGANIGSPTPAAIATPVNPGTP